MTGLYGGESVIEVIDEERARQLMTRPKSVFGTLEWRPRNNHAGHQILQGQFVDGDGALISGLTMQIEVKSPIVVQRCLYLFSLFSFHHGAKQRVYQLEVAPSNRRTHNSERGALYGPHEHIGADRVEAVQGLSCSDFDGAAAHFASQCSVLPPPPIPLLVLP